MASASTDQASGHAPVTCANHRKRERIATCGVCNSALCTDCIVHTAVGVKCRTCTGGAPATAPNASAKARGVAPEKKRRWPVPVAGVGALLLVIAGVAVLTRGDGNSTVVTNAPAPAGDGGSAQGGFVERVADFRGAGGLKLGATLAVPSNLGNKTAPGVLIVPGGGAQSRNGGIQFDTQLPDPLYQDLAESLATAGIVSLRYDRRGSPAAQLPTGVPVAWDDLSNDAKAGLDFLAQRRETQGQPITILGYDQGGFTAMTLAADPRVKGLVLISTPGRPLAEVLAFDFQRGVPDPAKGQAVADATRAAAAQLIATGTSPKAETLPEELRPIFSADPSYLRGLLAFDPVAEAAKVKVPTLLVRGGSDGSILPMDVNALKAVLAKSETITSTVGSNTLALPPGQEGRFHNPSRHGTTRDGDALIAIDDWLKATVK